MEKYQIKIFLTAIKNVCPAEYKATITPTQYRNTIYLAVIKYPLQEIDLDDWAIMSVYPLHFEKINPLLQENGNLRVIYCYANKFVI